MRTRSISSVGVVVVGLLPTLIGGPPFALLLAGLCLLAYREYEGLIHRLPTGSGLLGVGYWVIAAAGIAGLSGHSTLGLTAVVAIAVAAPLVAALFRPTADPFADWPPATAGSLYIGLPVFAAVALRDQSGTVTTDWFARLADWVAIGWAPQPRGLAWALIVIVAIWCGDSAAYLVGRRFGRTPLLPRVSPRKTVEGALAAVVASAAIGVLGTVVFGLGLPWLVGAAVGALLSVAGQVGDLAESSLKRRVGVKDSGALIPGHGGMLDRMDAMLFALPAGWLTVGVVDGLWYR